jgi:hypothetical protein
MSKLKHWLAIITLVVSLGGIFGTILTPQPALAIMGNPSCAKGFLTFPVWYRGVVDGKSCEIKKPDSGEGGNNKLSAFIWKIALNIIDIGLQLVGYIAVIFIIIGGFQLITGGDSPETVNKARQTIVNAAIGLAIALAAVAIVNLIVNNVINYGS